MNVEQCRSVKGRRTIIPYHTVSTYTNCRFRKKYAIFFSRKTPCLLAQSNNCVTNIVLENSKTFIFFRFRIRLPQNNKNSGKYICTLGGKNNLVVCRDSIVLSSKIIIKDPKLCLPFSPFCDFSVVFSGFVSSPTRNKKKGCVNVF